MYAHGWGVPQDDVEALGWFTLVIARSSGDSSGEDRDRSMKARESVAERMTSEQIADAQRRAREWRVEEWRVGQIYADLHGPPRYR